MTIEIGTHIAWVEDDILFLKIVDDLTMADITKYIKLAEELVNKYGSFYIVDDIARFRSASNEVRRVTADWLARNSCAGAVLHGGSLTARTIAILVVRAMNLLGKQYFPIVFMKTEQEAREWIAGHRRKMRGG